MIPVLAHEMYARQIQLAATRRTACDLENLGLLGIIQAGNLPQFLFGFGTIGLYQLLVLCHGRLAHRIKITR